eukprot:NODE_1331_length_1374_cov_64.078589_g1319_i0.p1 GENE.NODE_1331_length_1374_cov_64.078589_g1319_i0~~NODE_1331_length_1374_cov_64.078589_g1319_i0.p1  ORF type:complete len:437 (-),score=80.06 NODE_1331_length_1374_cov_64.078589_g1319_i0:63-1295(-)
MEPQEIARAAPPSVFGSVMQIRPDSNEPTMRVKPRARKKKQQSASRLRTKPADRDFGFPPPNVFAKDAMCTRSSVGITTMDVPQDTTQLKHTKVADSGIIEYMQSLPQLLVDRECSVAQQTWEDHWLHGNGLDALTLEVNAPAVAAAHQSVKETVERLRAAHIESMSTTLSQLIADAKLFCLRKIAGGSEMDCRHMFVVFCYCSESWLYRRCNAALQSPHQLDVQPWGDWIALLTKALKALPIAGNDTPVYRPISMPFDLGQYCPSRVPQWSTFTHFTTSARLARQALHNVTLDPNCPASLSLVVLNGTGRRVHEYSPFPDEKEVIFLPNMRVKVSKLLKPRREQFFNANEKFANMMKHCTPLDAPNPDTSLYIVDAAENQEPKTALKKGTRVKKKSRPQEAAAVPAAPV